MPKACWTTHEGRTETQAEAAVVGQHRVQRQILRNFSFGDRQLNSRETWWLNTGSYQPARRSTNRVGFFEVNCSEDVDGYITEHENTFKEPLRRFSQGEFTRTDVGRELYDFIAIHYVRSQACRRQIEHLVSECKRTPGSPNCKPKWKSNALPRTKTLRCSTNLWTVFHEF